MRAPCRRSGIRSQYGSGYSSSLRPAPELAIECNEKGVGVLLDVIERAEPQPKLIHISTMALYGNRNEKHMWGRVGDPLLISPFDLYSLTKMRGEFKVLESGVKQKP